MFDAHSLHSVQACKISVRRNLLPGMRVGVGIVGSANSPGLDNKAVVVYLHVFDWKQNLILLPFHLVSFGTERTYKRSNQQLDAIIIIKAVGENDDGFVIQIMQNVIHNTRPSAEVSFFIRGSR